MSTAAEYAREWAAKGHARPVEESSDAGWRAFRLEVWAKDARRVNIHVDETDGTVLVSYALLARMLRELGWGFDV